MRNPMPVVLVLTAFVVTPASFGASDGSAPPKRVLIVTGEDYKGHKWQLTTPVLKAQLAQDSRFLVEVTEDLKLLRSPSLHDFDVVVMHFKNYDPELPGRQGYDNLARFVRDGGGLVLVHFACGAFQEFKDDFVKLAGRAWNPELRGHDPHGMFRVEVVNQDHPITQGLASFETTDELYTCLEGQPPITVLAEAQSKVDGTRHPVAFVLPFGKGRVFHSVLGHDAAALSPAPVGELFRRGTAWSGGLAPSVPSTP
jgi:type 1 glutamine amidotransferase